MAPPGRRKLSISFLLPLLTLLLLSTTASAASAVLGIDLGTEYLKAAIAKPGSPIEIVLTKDSKRKEAATLAFKPSRAQTNDPEAFPERLYGGDALALSARYPGDVYSNLKSLLGLPADAEAVQDYNIRYPSLSLEPVPRTGNGKGQGTVGFKSNNAGPKSGVYMLEELLAMELKNIKANAEAAVVKGTHVTDVVITHPAFYSAEEKRAVELAADLAGLRVLGLISDGLAVGLNYATNRVFDSVTEGAKPEYHLVYDMGAGSTTATVLKFQGRTVKGPGKRNQTIQEVQVVGTGFDKTLGGDFLTDIVVNDMIAEIVQQPKAKKLGVEEMNLRSNGKSMARLWKDGQRLRQVLSANTASSASFEGLYHDDLNAKYSLTRDRFEELATKHLSRVDAPLTQALDQAGVTLTDLDSVILHGGVVRTPFVQKHLTAIAGGSSKIKTNVNADEAAVMGAAFKAAAVSPSFRVKDIRTTDISGATITLKWSQEGKEKQQKLFVPASQVGAEKQVPIKILENVKFEFTESSDSEISILEVEATNVTKSVGQLKDKYGCASSNISTVFNIRLNPFDGLPEVMSGSVSCKTDSSKDGGVIDNVKGLFGFGSKKSTDQEPLAGEEELPSEDSTVLTPLPVDDPTSSGSTMSSASPTEAGGSASTHADASSSTKSTKAPKATSSTVTIPLALKAKVLGLNTPPAASLAHIRQRLTQFDTSDRNAVLRSEALNTLEAFTYRVRDYLEDVSFIEVSSDKARKELDKHVSAASDWLYGEGIDAKLQDFKDKLKSLKGFVDPVLKRKDENSKRDGAVKALREGLESMSSIVQMVEGSVQRAAQEAALSASSTASSVVESVTASATTSLNDGEDLEDDAYGTKTGPESTEVESDLPLPKPYEYTEEDLASLTTGYDSAKTWLEEKLAAQNKLGPYDDPVVLVAELEAKAKQLQAQVSETIMKTIKMQEIPRKPKSSKKSKAKTKKSKGASSSSVLSSSTPSSSSTGSSSNKDEL